MDSLKRDSAGLLFCDSLIRLRPGLLDSLQVAERYFLTEGVNQKLWTGKKP